MFRFLFIYLPKLGHAWIALVLGVSLYKESLDFAGAVLVPTVFCGIAGAIYLLKVKKTIPCPICGAESYIALDEIGQQEEEYGVLCPNCGYVFILSTLSWKIYLKPKDGSAIRVIE